MERATAGVLSINGHFECYTLEPPITSYKGGPIAIPEGVYNVRPVWSVHNQRAVPLLEDVDGRSAIEMHHGDFVPDTLGCILVGAYYNHEAEPLRLFLSDWAFSTLWWKLNRTWKADGKVIITVSGEIESLPIAGIPEGSVAT